MPVCSLSIVFTSLLLYTYRFYIPMSSAQGSLHSHIPLQELPIFSFLMFARLTNVKWNLIVYFAISLITNGFERFFIGLLAFLAFLLIFLLRFIDFSFWCESDYCLFHLFVPYLLYIANIISQPFICLLPLFIIMLQFIFAIFKDKCLI